MKHLQAINEFFWNKNDADKIALEYINRLEKIKDQNPYNIKVEDSIRNDAGELYIYIVEFDDTPIRVSRAEFYSNTEVPKGHDRVDYRLWAFAEDERERIDCKKRYSRKLFNIIDNLYKNRGLYNVKLNINKAADLL